MSRTHVIRDMVAGGATVALGVFFLVASDSIQGFGDDPVGPKFLPQAVCLLMIVFGAVLGAGAWRSARANGPGEQPADAAEIDIRAVATLGLIGILYSVLFFLLGYLAATLLVFPAVLYLFGARSIGEVALTTAASIALFYLVFFGLLGIHDPPGLWLDLPALLR